MTTEEEVCKNSKEQKSNDLYLKMPSDVSAPEIDIYRDTPIRYCGYANEVGESFRPLIKKVFVHLSYAVSITYVLADCVDKSLKILKKADGTVKEASIKAGDVFLWQMLASVAIPGFVINRITWSSGKLLKMAKIKGMPRKWGATLTGLASIPFIIQPIDHSVDSAMDYTYRQYFSKSPCDS